MRWLRIPGRGHLFVLMYSILELYWTIEHKRQRLIAGFPKPCKAATKEQAAMSAEKKAELTIHYLRPGFELPDLDEVKKCQEQIGPGIYKISPTVVVKHGLTIAMLEAKNMLFIEQHTSIPIAKLQAAYSTPVPDRLHYPDDGGEPEFRKEPDYYYLFMEIVPGAQLGKCWDGWDEATKQNVQHELTDYIRQLRGIPGGDYIGTLDRGPVTDGMLVDQADSLGM
jgi:hypothetical protein